MVKNNNWKFGLFVFAILLFSSIAYAQDIESVEITDVYTIQSDLFSIFSSLFFQGGGLGYTAGSTAQISGDINEAFNVKCQQVRVKVEIKNPSGNVISTPYKDFTLQTINTIPAYLKFQPIKYTLSLKLSSSATQGTYLGKAYLECREDKSAFLAKNGGYNSFYPRISGYTQTQFMVVKPAVPNRPSGGCIINNICESGYETSETCPKDCPVKNKECDINEERTAGGSCVARKDVTEESKTEESGVDIRGNIVPITFNNLKTIEPKDSRTLGSYVCDFEGQCKESDSTCVLKTTLESAREGLPIFSLIPTVDQQVQIFHNSFERSDINGMINAMDINDKKGICVNNFPSTKINNVTGEDDPTSKSITINEEDLEDSSAQDIRDAICGSRFDCAKVDDDTKKVVCLDTSEIRDLIEEKTSTTLVDLFKSLGRWTVGQEKDSGLCVAVPKEDTGFDFFRMIGKLFNPNGLPDEQRQTGQTASIIGGILLFVLIIFSRK